MLAQGMQLVLPGAVPVQLCAAAAPRERFCFLFGA